MKKTVACLLTVATLLSAFGACKASPVESGNAPASSASISAPSSSGEEAVSQAKEETALTMFINSASAMTDKWGQDEISKAIIEQTGINLTLEKPSADDNQRLNLMVASGEKLPDMMVISALNPAFSQLKKAGKLYSLDELIDAHAPDFKELPLYKSDWKYMTGDDGKVYYIPAWWNERGKLDSGVFILGRNGYYLREDLLKELGSPKLETLGDLETVLTAAKEKFPDINPVTLWSPTTVDGGISDGGAVMMFYFSMGGQGRYFLQGDQVLSHAKDPLFKESLAYINKLYQKGLFAKTEFTDSRDQKIANNNNGKLFMGVGDVYLAGEGAGAVKDVNPQANYIPIPHLKGEGVQEVLVPAGLGSADAASGIVVTKDCADPEKAINFIKFLSDDDGQALQLMGVKGTHWDWAQEGKSIVAIGEYAELIKDWNAWADRTGGYKYVWAGGSFFDSALAWGFAESDSSRKAIYEIEAQIRDYSLFDGLIPPSDKPEAVLNQKYEEQWGRYVTQLSTADSDEDFEKIYAQFQDSLGKLGLDKLEAYWTERYQANLSKEGSL